MCGSANVFFSLFSPGRDNTLDTPFLPISKSCNAQLSRSAKKSLLVAKQTKAFEELDKMMEELLEHNTIDFNTPIVKNSISDGNIV